MSAPEQRSRGYLARRIVQGAAANFTVPLAAIVTGPLLARTLGPEGRGELAGIVIPITFVSTIGLLGVPLAATYFTARGAGSAGKVFRAALPIIVCTSIVAVALLFLLAPVLMHGYPQDVRLFRIASLTVPLGLVIDVMGGIALGQRRYGLVYLWAVVGALGRALVLVVLALFGSLTVRSAVLATLLMGVFGLVIFLRVNWGERSEGELEQHLTRRLGSYGLRSWGIALAGLANARLDQVLLLPVAGAVQLGYYSVAVSLAELSAPVTSAVAQVVFPEASGRREWSNVAQASRCTVLLTSCVAVCGVLLSPVVIPLVFGQDFSSSVRMAQVLFFAAIPLGLRLVLGSGLLAAGRPGASSTSQFIALGVTLPGLALLVPSHGAIGAAWTSLAAYSVACVFNIWQVTRVTGMPVRTLTLPTRADVVWVFGQLRQCLPPSARPRTAT